MALNYHIAGTLSNNNPRIFDAPIGYFLLLAALADPIVFSSGKSANHFVTNLQAYAAGQPRLLVRTAGELIHRIAFLRLGGV